MVTELRKKVIMSETAHSAVSVSVDFIQCNGISSGWHFFSENLELVVIKLLHYGMKSLHTSVGLRRVSWTYEHPGSRQLNSCN